MPNRKRRDSGKVTRRRFLRQAGAVVAAAGFLNQRAPAAPTWGQPPVPGFSIFLVRDPTGLAATPAVQWAINSLATAVNARGGTLHIVERLDQAASADQIILLQKINNLSLPSEFLAMIPTGNTLAVSARDARGLAYALTDLADRVACGSDPLQSLKLTSRIMERPANRIRSIMRMFVSDVEDKAWFHDRDFWPRYFSMLATERFNRFNLGLSLGYDAPQHLRDTYFYFPYPFLFAVPGYNVRAVGLADEERDRNLESLRFIGEQAAAHGLDFQLGLWTHAFKWIDSPNANYVIDGLTSATQAPYCRDALAKLLAECPTISGLTFRTHGESGVAEGSYDFWKTLFSAVSSAGRAINIDLHAKGITQEMIDIALAASPKVTVSPKFWAEHMGLPYLQASIREEEMPKERAGNGFFALSGGARSFMRYSYGDLFRSDRKYGILHRVWPGTQRLLLWGDPKFAAGYGRIFSQLGADGVEYFDPLSFKGRKGSGLPDDGDRIGYYLHPLRPAGGDWEKYVYTYRLLGRLSYNPDAEPETWQRGLRLGFGKAAAAAEEALSNASRILPLITSAHDPSAANANYWPEMYTNMSLFDANHFGSYGDTPRPRVFGNVSSLDPQMFASVAECAQAILEGQSLAKYTPMDVAKQLELWSTTSLKSWQDAKDLNGGAGGTSFRRWDADVTIAAMLGLFFAMKFRAAIAYEIFNRTGYGLARTMTDGMYVAAREAWSRLSDAAGVYKPDLTFGPDAQLRGHWSDRLAAIDKDIAAIPKTASGQVDEHVAATALQRFFDQAKVGGNAFVAVKAAHVAPRSFKPGETLELELTLDRKVAASVRLWYRRMNQAERYHWQAMEGKTDQLSATIPAEFTQTPYPIQYYFAVQNKAGGVSLYPGLGEDFLQTPYFIVENHGAVG